MINNSTSAFFKIGIQIKYISTEHIVVVTARCPIQ